MDDLVVLDWTFTPPDYFEEIIVIKRNMYTMTIDNGKVEARIGPTIYDKEPNMRNILHDELNDRFLGVQLMTYKAYTLSKASMHRLHSDGRKDITIFSELFVNPNTFFPFDIVTNDKDGNVVSDSRKDRIDKKKKFAELVVKYRSQDKVLESLLMSYETAINDPDNEFVHLFEIREALTTRFGNENNVRKALSINEKKFSGFRRLCNNKNLKQGRHRGQNNGILRDANEEELKTARDFAKLMIEAYINYLEYLETSPNMMTNSLEE